MDNTTQQSITSLPPQGLHQEVPHSSSSSKKLFIVIGVVIILGLISGAVYYLGAQKNALKTSTVYPTRTVSATPTIATDATTNWETYSNNNAGYKFLYPSNFKLIKNVSKQDMTATSQIDEGGLSMDDTSQKKYTFVIGTNSSQEYPNYSIIFYVHKHSATTTNGWLSKNDRITGYFYAGGEKGTLYSSNVTPVATPYAVITTNGYDYIFEYTWATDKSTKTEYKYLPIFNKILSTIKFFTSVTP